MTSKIEGPEKIIDPIGPIMGALLILAMFGLVFYLILFALEVS